MILRGDWGDRTTFLAWAVGHPSAHPFVAESDGRVIATGVATANGRVGWLGAIFVDVEARGAGIGTALTQTVTDDLEARGCRTLVLIATDEGRRVYERLGFTVATRYLRMVAPATPPGPDRGRVRPFAAADLAAITALDRTATGEDRSAVLRAFATEETGRVASRPDGAIGGFLVRASWGGSALIAAEPDDAVTLLDWRRRRRSDDRTLVIGVLEDNAAGRARLVSDGWIEQPGGPRMTRGEPLTWRPDWIYGQFGGALG
jgi:hypothetical protein